VTEVPAQFQATEGLVQDSMMRMYMAQMVAVDLEALEQSFRRLVTDRDLRERMSVAAREQGGRFTWQRIIGEYEVLWQSLRDIASSSPWQPRRGPMRLKQDPAHAYSHYASRLLGPESTLQITALGHHVFSEPGALIRYDDNSVLLFDALEKLVLGELSKGERTIEALRAAALAALEADSGLVDFHLMWLLKHGALRLVGG
jgi:hypothetical protein